MWVPLHRWPADSRETEALDLKMRLTWAHTGFPSQPTLLDATWSGLIGESKSFSFYVHALPCAFLVISHTHSLSKLLPPIKRLRSSLSLSFSLHFLNRNPNPRNEALSGKPTVSGGRCSAMRSRSLVVLRRRRRWRSDVLTRFWRSESLWLSTLRLLRFARGIECRRSLS